MYGRPTVFFDTGLKFVFNFLEYMFYSCHLYVKKGVHQFGGFLSPLVRDTGRRFVNDFERNFCVYFHVKMGWLFYNKIPHFE